MLFGRRRLELEAKRTGPGLQHLQQAPAVFRGIVRALRVHGLRSHRSRHVPRRRLHLPFNAGAVKGRADEEPEMPHAAGSTKRLGKAVQRSIEEGGSDLGPA